MSDRITINLPCKKEFVVVARMTATVVASKLNFNIEEIEDIKIAVSEACNNAIQHSRGEEDFFNVVYTVDDQAICIEIVDNGKGFNLDEYQKPDLDELKGNGLGIFIMRSLMDEVVIESQPNTGTVVKLIKNL